MFYFSLQKVLLLTLLLFIHSAQASYQGYIFVHGALTVPEINPGICSRFAADHISKLGFTVSKQTDFMVNAQRGKERVVYNCDFGTTYGGRGLLSIAYIPEGEEGYTVPGAYQTWLAIKNPKHILGLIGNRTP